jgi:hypothetical protein
MSRLLCLLALPLFVAGCQTVSTNETPLAPPDKDVQYTYAQLLTRVRDHAKQANEAFYRDEWGRFEDAAKCIEDEARLIPKSSDPPSKFKPDQIQGLSRDLADSAVKLREAAKAKNVNAATDAMTLVSRKVYELRLGD